MPGRRRDEDGLVRRTLQNPERLMPLAFLGAIVLGTALLMLPVSRAGPGHAPVMTAIFTATSAICVAGLSVTDAGEYWSTTGLVFITVLTEIGGFGILTLATLLGLAVAKRLGMRSRLAPETGSGSLALPDIRRVLARIALIMVTTQTVTAILLTGRLWLGYHYPPGRALGYGTFHAAQGFNNAGFALWPDSLVGFVGDPWMCLPLALGAIVGALGFPALFESSREWRNPGRWSVHTRLTVWGTLSLLALGFLVVLTFEWSNPGTLGPLNVGQKMLAAFFQDTMTRSGGLNSIPTDALNQETVGVTIVMMFIGGGTASTAGGIKVATFFLLAFVIWTEIRGEPEVVVGRRRVAGSSQRQALTIALLAITLLTASTLLLIALTNDLEFHQALFEVTSAFGTVGLSLGITADLPAAAQIVLAILMFIGRVGSISVGSALALNTRHRLYRYPEERTLVG